MPKRGKHAKKVSRQPWNIVGKVVLVTGANTGIGKATVLELAKMGAQRVIMACRNLEQAEKAADEIRQKIDTNQTTLVIRHLDLSSMESVRKFCKQMLASEKKLHVIINNAGMLAPSRLTRTVDGHELTFATNHLGHFLMTNLLMPLLKKSAPARIVNVSTHWFMFALYSYWFRLNDPNFVQDEKAYWNPAVYSHTKYCNILFTHSLAKKLQGTGVTAYSVHPGVIGSDIARDFNIVFRTLVPYVFPSTKNGAKTSIYCATEPGIEHLSSNYFM